MVHRIVELDLVFDKTTITVSFWSGTVQQLVKSLLNYSAFEPNTLARQLLLYCNEDVSEWDRPHAQAVARRIALWQEKEENQ